MRLTDFSVLSFDCYGTLIDWESGLFSALQPLLLRSGVGLPREMVLQAFAVAESRQQVATPGMRYAELLAVVHTQLARDWGTVPDAAESARFGASVGDWPAFPDTAEALRWLEQRFRLVILSNVDRDSFRATLPRLGVTFHAIFTAEEIGSYKPNPRNFAYLIERMAVEGTPHGRILHVAQSLFHDHAPANAAGLASAWIDRRHTAEAGAELGTTPGAIRAWGATAPPPLECTTIFASTAWPRWRQRFHGKPPVSLLR